MEIVRTRAFERSLKKLGASDDDIAALENEIAANPETGDVIPGLGGARKIRFAMKSGQAWWWASDLLGDYCEGRRLFAACVREV